MKSDDKNPTTDEDLMLAIACCAQSDIPEERRDAEQAFAVLYDRHEKSLRHTILEQKSYYPTFRIDVDDVFQELCARIWEKAEKFGSAQKAARDTESPFLSWAAAISRNLIRDRIKAVKIDCRADFDDAFFLKALPDFEESERVKIAAKVLRQMKPDQQEILYALIEAARLDGKQLRTSPEELRKLSQRLGVTVPSLGMKRKRAIERFKTLFEQEVQSLTVEIG